MIWYICIYLQHTRVVFEKMWYTPEAHNSHLVGGFSGRFISTPYNINIRKKIEGVISDVNQGFHRTLGSLAHSTHWPIKEWCDAMRRSCTVIWLVACRVAFGYVAVCRVAHIWAFFLPYMTGIHQASVKFVRAGRMDAHRCGGGRINEGIWAGIKVRTKKSLLQGFA